MELIAPEVPDAQKNQGPALFLQALGQGLASAARFAEMRRQSEMDVLRLAEHERVSQEQTALEREKMALDYDLRQTALSSTMELNRAHADYYKAGAKAYTEGTKTAAQRAIAFNQQRQDLVNDVNQQVAALQLDDPNFATKQPVAFAANVMKFEDMFGLSPLPEVKHAITRYRTQADQQKVPIRVGATFDEESNAWKGGTVQHVPVWQIVRNMQDPTQAEQTVAALEASGQTRIIEGWQEVAGTRKDGEKFSTKVPSKTTELSPVIKSAMEEGKGVKFERQKSRVPAAMLPKSAAGGTEPTALPEPDLPVSEPTASATPKFDETQTDKIIRQAKAALAKGARRDAVAARLVDMGIDPGALLEAAA